jgi:dTDP-4-dehydrorhamnose reductase
MNTQLAAGIPQLWGGIECSIVRLKNCWRDQCVETGHADRLSDIDLIAGLGIKTLRYPVLWETVSPDEPRVRDFSWHDVRLARLRELGVEVIAGLLHHGSGPKYTNLLDPHFPGLLAQHALDVAQRYPWLRQFTPVNEPLTTARFSALYGHWYPHQRNLRDFARALVNQCQAVCLSMRAIRTVTPDAQLIQTEDLGKVFSTPLVDYQAQYENERRWLTFDLLLGHVDRHHPWFSRLVAYGITERELMEFVAQPCAPDIVGVNHYLTSERFLDHRRPKWPNGIRGSSNGRHRYADLEAVRMQLPPGTVGPEARLREVCDRYGLPVAVTEVHHGCSRDEQLRWFVEVWNSATALAAEGKPIGAVTAWALFGGFDWNSLLTQRNGSYEPGAFDIRSPQPRPTAIGKAIRTITSGRRPDHALLATPGWWRREMRFYHPHAAVRTDSSMKKSCVLLVGGSDGPLAETLKRICIHRGLAYVALEDKEISPSDPTAIAKLLDRYNPWAVVNARENTNAQLKPDGRGHFLHANAALALSIACRTLDIALLTFSSDSVFDGREPRAFVEEDAPAPPSIDGLQNAEVEKLVLANHPRSLIVRSSALYDSRDIHGFVSQWLRAFSRGRPILLPADIWCSPTYTPDLAHAALDLLIDGEAGIWHLVNEGPTTWHGFGLQLVRVLGLSRNLVVGEVESRRISAGLSSTRGKIMPTVASGMTRFLQEWERHRYADPNLADSKTFAAGQDVGAALSAQA